MQRKSQPRPCPNYGCCKDHYTSGARRHCDRVRRPKVHVQQGNSRVQREMEEIVTDRNQFCHGDEAIVNLWTRGGDVLSRRNTPGNPFLKPKTSVNINSNGQV